MSFKKGELREYLKSKGVKSTEDLQEVLRELTKEVIETLYEEEMANHLGYEKNQQNINIDGNSRNGHASKKVKSQIGEIELKPPRDRLSTFDPIVVKKRQNDISGIEAKVISMYGKGMTTRDISSHIHDIYGYSLSAESISAMTDKVLDKVKEWQSRPLEAIYPIIFMDGIVVKLKKDGVVQNVTAYVVLGFNLDGYKSCLGIYIGESESAKYWLSVLNELKNRGVKDILIFSVDNLAGISEAIQSAFPKSEIQKCVVHQIRNSLKYVPYKDRKQVAKDLKLIYSAATEDQGKAELDNFSEKWALKYPHIIKSWKKNWNELSSFYKYSKELRSLIYTTNPIESFHRNLRKVTKTRSIFPSEDSLLKLFYLAIMDIEKKWTQIHRNWGQIFSQLVIYFEDRLGNYL